MKLVTKAVTEFVLLFTLFLISVSSQGIAPLPPIPIDELTTQLILPGEQIQAIITAKKPIHTYLFPVFAGNVVELNMNRLKGDLVPFLRLRTVDGRLISEQTAQGLAGRSVNIEHMAEQDEWYLIDVSYDPASESYGTYELRLLGAINLFYDLLDSGQPPFIEDAIYLTRGSIIELEINENTVFLLSMNANEILQVSILPSENSEFLLTDVSGQPLISDDSGEDGFLTYTLNGAGWYISTLLIDEEDDVQLSIDVVNIDMPSATLAGYRLGDLITPSPLPTSTNTPLPTATPSPTSTSHPTSTQIPTSTPIVCSGTLLSRLQVGDTARVTPGPSNNLRDRPTVNGARLTQIPGGARFDVLEGPVCAGGYAWYRIDYNGIIGWTAEANSSTYWLEPI
jgi:hypothetical protein